MSRLRIALQGRDTCNGACETEGGCTCLRPQISEKQLDARIKERREFSDAITAERMEREMSFYRRGWISGLVGGVVAGGLLVAIALMAGLKWTGA